MCSLFFMEKETKTTKENDSGIMASSFPSDRGGGTLSSQAISLSSPPCVICETFPPMSHSRFCPSCAEVFGGSEDTTPFGYKHFPQLSMEVSEGGDGPSLVYPGRSSPRKKTKENHSTATGVVCTLCHKLLAKTSLRRHIHTAHPHSVQCPVHRCLYVGATASAVENHIKEEHGPKSSSSHLTQATKKTTSGQEQPLDTFYHCPMYRCSYLCSQKTELQEHKKKEHPLAMDCPQCHRYFCSKKQSLLKHFKKSHPDCFCCPVHRCLYVGATASAVENHRKEEHGPKSSSSHLTQATKTTSGQEQPLDTFPCRVSRCSYVSSDPTELQEHKKKEHPFTMDCPQCGAWLANNDTLGKHLVNVHALHTCPVYACRFLYSTAEQRQQHIRSTHSHRFPCRRCMTSFATERGRDNHQRKACGENR